jgi:hypothetical protein
VHNCITCVHVYYNVYVVAAEEEDNFLKFPLHCEHVYFTRSRTRVRRVDLYIYYCLYVRIRPGVYYYRCSILISPGRVVVRLYVYTAYFAAEENHIILNKRILMRIRNEHDDGERPGNAFDQRDVYACGRCW